MCGVVIYLFIYLFFFLCFLLLGHSRSIPVSIASNPTEEQASHEKPVSEMSPNQQDPPVPLPAASLKSQPVLTEAHNINPDVLSSGVLCLPGGYTWDLCISSFLFLHVHLFLVSVSMLL